MTGYLLEVAVLFGVVIIHELGHAAAAKSFGWRVREVKLLPFGGVAEVEEGWGVPLRQEVAVVLAGPLQNVWMLLLGVALTEAGWISPEWGSYFIEANLFIALFNLLPALPLDGGKLMLAAFSLWFPFRAATQLASVISIVFSLLFIAGSFVYALTPDGGIQLNWLLIGSFLLAANWSEWRNRSYRFIRFLMHREAVIERIARKGALAQPVVIGGHLCVSDVVKLLLREKLHMIYVLDRKGQIQRVLPERKVVEQYFDERGRSLPLSEQFP